MVVAINKQTDNYRCSNHSNNSNHSNDRTGVVSQSKQTGIHLCLANSEFIICWFV